MLKSPLIWPESVSELVAEAADIGSVTAIRTALKAIRKLSPAQQGRSFKLGICRSFTIETQLDALELGLATLPCRPEITVGDLENIEQSLLDDKSVMLQTSPNALLVLWRLEELHPRLVFEYDGMSSKERENAVTDVIKRIEDLCAEYEKISTIPLFLSTLPELSTFGNVTSDVYSLFSPRQAILRINQVLLDLTARNSRIYIFDFSRWALTEGIKAFDLKMDMFARQPISNRSLISFANMLADTFRPLLLSPAKVLALDLDNVLWGGVLGEDGVAELKIGHDFPGNIYRRIQQYAIALKNRGILLVLLSKNNLSDVELAFAELSEIPLKLDDFAAIRVNWNEKYKNIIEIAEELNLGLDSFVFVDDQEFEREQMQFNLADVHVLAVSEDPVQTLRALMDAKLFDLYRVNKEDSSRNDDYIAQSLRQKFKSENKSSQKFLASLQMQANIKLLTDKTIPRFVQMLVKTNQFNVTTRRHLEADVRRMLAEAENIMLLLSINDRFGDQGIIGLAIMLGDEDSKVIKIDSFLLSCRAIGRGAEEVLWSSLLSHIPQDKYTSLESEYLRTTKNHQVADLFTKFGMTKKADSTEDHSTYVLDLPFHSEPPKWIKVIDET